MRSRFLRWLARLGGASIVFALFTLAAYLSFSQFVRRGVTPVPDVAGLPRAEAEALLADSGLALEIEEEAERHDDTVPVGAVLQQKPAARSFAKRGSVVRVGLSLGPEVVEVPDLDGLDLTAARVALGNVGLRMGRAVAVYRLSGPSGTVAEQEPAAGQMVGYAAEVDVYLGEESHAETFLMPDLIYRDHDLVRHFFERRGFQLGGVKPEPYEGVAEGVILRQYPLAGHPLTRNDVISLVVSIPSEERG